MSAVTSTICGALVAVVLAMAGMFFIPAMEEAQPVGVGWQVDLLAAVGNDQPTEETILFLSAWHRAEGGSAAYNWLNTTQPAQGDSLYNSVGVRNYPDYAQGIEATAQTLMNGFYPRTLQGLLSNAPIVDDGELGVWGTGGSAVRRQLEETQWGDSTAVSLPQGFTSNPISLDGDCGWNVQVALEANGGALQAIELSPDSTFSFNATMGTPANIPYRNCAGVPGGNWCNLAARYAQTARALGLIPLFQDHGIGDLGAGPENSVAIWNEGGIAGEGQDLLIQNTTNQTVWFRAVDLGGAVAIEGGYTQ